MLPPKIILAATDFSEASQPALAAAAQLARGVGAELHVVHAEDPLLEAGARESGFNLPEQTLDELRVFVARAIPPGSPSVRLHVVGGQPIDVVLDVAQRKAADLIVMGTHGHTGFGRVVFGSVAEGVLRRSHVPVLVIPSPRP